MSRAFLSGESMTGGYGQGPHILHDCNISVAKGEIAVIVGPNGAGKSTTLNMLLRSCNPTCGDAFILGTKVTSLN